MFIWNLSLIDSPYNRYSYFLVVGVARLAASSEHSLVWQAVTLGSNISNLAHLSLMLNRSAYHLENDITKDASVTSNASRSQLNPFTWRGWGH